MGVDELGNDELNAAVLKASEEEGAAESSTDLPPKQIIQEIREWPTHRIAERHASIQRGMTAFFSNDFAAAETIFYVDRQSDPLAASSWGTVATFRALLSFEPRDAAVATERLSFASSFARKVAPKERSAVASLALWVVGKNRPSVLRPSEFRAVLVDAESQMLRGMVLAVGGSLTAYIRAAGALHAGYGVYDRLKKYLEVHGNAGLDDDSIGGVNFGLGLLNLVVSILPPRVVRILRALGYTAERERGFALLRTAMDSNTIRTPLAAFALLAFHGVLPTFATLMRPSSLSAAREVAQGALTVYPHSALHIWLSGRVSRVANANSEAAAAFERCIALCAPVKEQLPQLPHFAQYDLAWSRCVERQWGQAAALFRTLEVESKWSRKFYAFAQGACADTVLSELAPVGATPFPQAPDHLVGATYDAAMARAFDSNLSDDTRIPILNMIAAAAYARAAAHPSTSLAGKPISVDQFVARRLGRAKLPDPEARVAPTTELMLHFGILGHVTEGEARDLLPLVTAMAKHTTGTSMCHVAELVKATLLRRAGEPVAAGEALAAARAGRLGPETWVAPYGLFEHALQLHDAGDTEGCRTVMLSDMDKAVDFDFDFAISMQFRLHLTQDTLRRTASPAGAPSPVIPA